MTDRELMRGEALAGPLLGRRIVVTRTREQAGTLADGLRKLGAEVIELPTIEIVPPDSYAPLDDALRSLASYEWLVVTSANAVRAIGDRLGVLGLTPATLANSKIAAVGASTAEALRVLGATAALIPPKYVAESLAQSLHDHVSASSRILIARASVARDVIPDALAALGASVDVVDAYRTVRPNGALVRARELFAVHPEGSVALHDCVTFTSSSTVRHFLGLLVEAGIIRPLELRAVSIGPVTSATLRDCGWEPAAEADPHDVQGLIEATVRALMPKS